MKKLFLKIGLVVLLFYSCEEIFFEDDISDAIVDLISPTDNAIFDTSTITFNWNEIEGVEQFQLQIASPTFLNGQIILDTILFNIDSLTVKKSLKLELTPNEYQWRVRGKNSAYNTDYSTNSFQIITLNTNDNIKLLSPENNLISNYPEHHLSWETINYATNYRLQIWKPNTSGELLEDLIVKSSDTIINFNEGAYSWQVRAENNDKSTAYASRSILIDFTAPNTPQLLSPENSMESIAKTINFSWKREAIEGSDEIDSLFVYQNEALSQIVFKEKVAGNSMEYEFSPNTYYWYVKSYDEAGNTSEKSEMFSFTILEGISQSTVELISPEDNVITNNNLQTLSWEAVDNTDDYRVQILKADGTEEVVLDITTEETEKDISFQDGLFNWQVRAQNSLQETAYTSRTILVDTKVPNTPTQIAPLNLHKQIENTIHFQYERQSIEGSEEMDSLFVYADESLTDRILKAAVFDSSNYQVFETGTYYWYLKSYDKAGNESEKSTVKSFIILDDLSQSIVKLISPEDQLITNTISHNLSWDAIENADDYQLQILKADGSNTLIFDITTEDTEKEVSFQDGIYNWQVKARNSIQETEYTTRTILVDTKVPNTPILILPENSHEQIENTIHFQYTRQALEGSEEIDSLFVFTDSLLSDNILKTKVSDNNYYQVFETGNYYWYIKSYDKAGNSSAEGEVFSFTILEDFAFKSVELISPENELITNTPQQTLKWNLLEEAIDYRVLIHKVDENTILQDYILPITSKTITFDDGYFTWKVRAQSSTQNTQYTTRNILIDTTAPNTSILQSPSDAQTLTNTTVHFIWNRQTIDGSIEKSTIYAFSDVALTNQVFNTEVSENSLYRDMVPGTYYWYVITNDEAGNTSNTSEIFSFTVE